MATIKNRVFLISVCTLLAFTIFASSGKRAFADVLLVSQRGEAGFVEDDATGQEALADDLLNVDEEVQGEVKEAKGAKQIVALFAASKEKLKKVSVAKDVALRDLTNAIAMSSHQWPFALVALLLVMLMMRFRRRSRKSKF